MIVLGKNYSINGNHFVVYPIGKIEGNKIIAINRENRNEILPNGGKIYTPPFHQKLTTGNFMLYELEASSTYEKNNEYSHYYSVKQTMTSAPLFEVYNLEESFDENADAIVKKIRFGFYSKVEPLERILLRTSDNYLLGPFKTNYDTDDKKVELINNFEVDKYILNVYDNFRNQLNIATYDDDFDKVKRSFALEYPSEENVINELDIATNDYIVKEAIKALRGQEEFGDITRRVSKGINEWLKDTTFSEEYIIKRLKSTLNLLKEIAPEHDDNNYKKYTKELLTLPSVQSIIDEQKEKKFELEIEKVLKENKDLINKNNELKSEHSKLISEISANQKSLIQIQQNIERYSRFMIDKKNNMEEEILEHYFQQLIISNLSSNQSNQLSFLFDEEPYNSLEKFETVKDMKKVFKYNLRQYEERDVHDLFFDYFLLALKFNQPLIIVGKSSFKLAHIIQKSFAASKSQTIIPDTTHFSLNVLDDIKNEQGNPFNFTVIHNIHTSSASLNLSGFINTYESTETNNKMIFTFDSFDESKFILEQLKACLILDIKNSAFLPSPFESSMILRLGQLEYEILSKYVQPRLSFQESIDELLDGFIDNDYKSIEKIEIYLKNAFKKVTYTNQFLKNIQKTLSYFPFLEESMVENSYE